MPSVAKQYNFVPAKGQQSRALITMGLGGRPPPNILAGPLFEKSTQVKLSLFVDFIAHYFTKTLILL